MPFLDRRKLLHAGVAFAFPIGVMPLLSGCGQPDDHQKKSQDADETNPSNPVETESTSATHTDKKVESENMQIQYLEIVTPDVDAICKQYSEAYGITFGDPVAEFGNAYVADLAGGGLIGVRAPMRDDENPVVRPYGLVEDIDAAVAAAKEAGAEVAIPPMEIPGRGKFAILIQGGIEYGFWKV